MDLMNEMGTMGVGVGVGSPVALSGRWSDGGLYLGGAVTAPFLSPVYSFYFSASFPPLSSGILR